ncbi:MAG TPA: M28 family peptidase [Pyrinomonadaceae bacterium]|mgnify:CR=1 FL=1|nr:M28 family peptidase [Pyrinomonadaceae bacterium]
MRSLGGFVLLVLTMLAVGQEAETQLAELGPALRSVEAKRISEHVKKLASDKFEGRAPGTTGETLTVNYLAEQFIKSGVKPGDPNGTYFQNVALVGYRTVPQIEVEAAGKKVPFVFLDDFVHDFPVLRPSATVKNAPIVFAGYGIVAPQYGWDDYKGLDVRGKLVIVLSGEPAVADKSDPKKLDASMFRGETRTYYSTRDFKFDLAAEKGAAGILIVYDPTRANTYSLFQTFAKMEGFALKPTGATPRTLISGLMTLDAAKRIFSASGQDLEKLSANAEQVGFSAVETQARAEITVRSKLRNIVSRNVVARIEGSDPVLKNEYVIYSAHWDHLGRDRKLKGDQIYNGAIDNAIGTAMLLEVANGFASLPKRPRRSILFIATTSEEKGYLGSRHYAQNPLYPIGDAVANINLDGGNAWGITKDVLSANYGLSTLDETLEESALMQKRGFLRESLGDGGLYYGSDQMEFAKAGIPSIFPFSGFDYAGKPKDFGEGKWNSYSDNDYHQVSDEIRPDWDLSGAAEDARWLLIAGWKISQAPKRPQWKAESEFINLGRKR